MKCPNCNNEVAESNLMASVLTDSLLCCPQCKGKSKHKAVIGKDPALVYGEIESIRQKKIKENAVEHPATNAGCHLKSETDNRA